MTLDAKCEAAVERWVEQAPPLSEHQKDIISAAFSGALKKTAPPDHEQSGGAGALGPAKRKADGIGQGRVTGG